MSPRGVPGIVPPSGTASGRLARRRQFARLAEVEATPEYAEMRAAADARALAESAVPKHGNGWDGPA